MDTESEVTSKTKTKGRPLGMPNWILESKFPNEKSATDHLTAEGMWPDESYSSRRSSRKKIYRCNRAEINGPPCLAMKCLYFSMKSKKVSLYTTKTKHNHTITPATNKKHHPHQLPNETIINKLYRRMESALKVRIVELIKQMQSPNEIILQLKSEGFQVKHRTRQIRNYCKYYTEKKINKWTFEKSFHELEDAKMFVKQQQMWRFKCLGRSDFGMTYHYQCNMVPKVGQQCEARKYVNFNKYTNEVTLYQKDSPHTHADIIHKENLNSKTVWLLKQLIRDDRNALKEQGFRVLQAVGLQNCLIRSNTNDYNTSFGKKSCTNFDSQIKNINVTVPVEVNLAKGNYDNNKKLNYKTKSRPLFTWDWTVEAKFPDEEVAFEYLAKDDRWIIDVRRVYAVVGGRKVHYRCNRVKLNAPQCAARKCLLYSNDSSEIFLYKNDSEHTHDKIEVKFRMNISDMPKELGNPANKNADVSVHPVRSKRDRSCTNTRNIISQEDSINDQVKENKFIDSSFEPLISIGNNATSMELVTGDDSIQYVISYIDDDQISYEDMKQVNQVAALSSESNSNWFVEKSFATFAKARKYLKEFNWSNVRTTTFQGNRRIYYRCNMVKRCGPQCRAQVYLVQCDNKILVHRNTEQHTHDEIIKTAKASPTRSWKNIQYPKPERAMLISPPSENVNELITYDNTSDDQFMQFVVDNDNDFPTDNITFDKKFKWRLNHKIPNNMISSYLNKQGTWRCKYRSEAGSKVFYCCTTQECEAQMCLVYDNRSIEIYVSGEHSHGVAYETGDLPIHFNGIELVSDSYINSNNIVKEELIIGHELVATAQNLSLS